MTPRHRFNYRGRDYDVIECKEALNSVIHYLREYSYYAPLMDRFPIRIDDEVPKSQRQELVDNETCACADGNNVYVDTELMTDIINGDIKVKGGKLGDNDNLFDCVCTIIAHEYTHILCLHHELGLRVWNKYNGKVPNVVVYAHQYACEVEANRGSEVVDDCSVYKCGVNDLTYPDARHYKYYSALFEYFLRLGKDKQQEIAKMLKSAMKSAAASANAQGDGDMGEKMKQLGGGGSKKGENNGNDNKRPKDGSDDGNDNGNGRSSSDARDGGDNDGTGIEFKIGNNDKGDSTNDDDEWEELTEEQIKDAINNANEAVKDAGPGSEKGIGLESTQCPYKPNLSPKERLDAEYARWDEKRVKKELRKMKGLIKGTVSKNRESTYARPTRRPISGGTTLIKKGVRYEKSYSPKVLIAMDSSGSMCSTTMKEVACAIENIFKDLGKPKVGSYICKHESHVSDVKPMRDWKKVVESYYPSGGNCFLHVVEEANKLGVDVVLNIGDGQDVVSRSSYYNENSGLEPACGKFLSNNRKWFDVLVTNKNDNRYYKEEAAVDERAGFHREAIYLGDKISKYFK